MNIKRMQWESQLDWGWLVKEYEPDLSQQEDLPTFKTIRQGEQWDSELDKSNLFLPIDPLIIIKKDGAFGYYNKEKEFIEINGAPTEEDFKNFGMSSFDNIDMDELLSSQEIEFLNFMEDDLENILQVKGTLKSQFVTMQKTIPTEEIRDIQIIDNGLGLKYLFSTDGTTWKRFDGVWNEVTWQETSDIAFLGMSKNAVKDIKDYHWRALGKEIYVGIYLETASGLNEVNHRDSQAIGTPLVKDANLYILNTLATIEMELRGNLIYGNISDEDEGKVQYRIMLNGEPLEPSNGEFTELLPEPQNISLRMPTEKIKIGETNYLTIEFQDAWGNTDTWKKSFIGEIHGLLFTDKEGDLYTDDEGNVIKRLDFGEIISGQVSVSQHVIFKNTTGNAVKNVRITSDWGVDDKGEPNKPVDGVTFLFSRTEAPFEGAKEIVLEEPLEDGQAIDLFIRVQTVLGVTPTTSGTIKFCAEAEEISKEALKKLKEKK